MVCNDIDSGIKDIPGYKVILKTVLKGVIQQIVSNDWLSKIFLALKLS